MAVGAKGKRAIKVKSIYQPKTLKVLGQAHQTLKELKRLRFLVAQFSDLGQLNLDQRGKLKEL